MSNKRPRLDSTSCFLDVEAQVNEHDSDSSEEEEDETDFIDHGTIDPEYSEMRRLESLHLHALLPTLNDPSLWIINIKPGMEKDADESRSLLGPESQF
ncbi:hypothetical protein AcV5_002431 [Taiwanofungus camphoratus]|nr:hypothetical protein AcV5_002431 [Antrodia cinnamomea]